MRGRNGEMHEQHRDGGGPGERCDCDVRQAKESIAEIEQQHPDVQGPSYNPSQATTLQERAAERGRQGDPDFGERSRIREQWSDQSQAGEISDAGSRECASNPSAPRTCTSKARYCENRRPYQRAGHGADDHSAAGAEVTPIARLDHRSGLIPDERAVRIAESPTEPCPRAANDGNANATMYVTAIAVVRITLLV